MTLWIALLVAIQAVPPPVPQKTAECMRPVYASDQLVCGDPALRAVDATLRELTARQTPPQGPWIEAPESWFRRSRLCAMQNNHRGCLLEAYQERIAVLSLDQIPAKRKWCGHFQIATRPDGTQMLYSTDGGLLGVARSVTKNWTPFVRSETARGRVIFRDHNGKVLARCG